MKWAHDDDDDKRNKEAHTCESIETQFVSAYASCRSRRWVGAGNEHSHPSGIAAASDMCACVCVCPCRCIYVCVCVCWGAVPAAAAKAL